jgi:hypothetical protein
LVGAIGSENPDDAFRRILLFTIDIAVLHVKAGVRSRDDLATEHKVLLLQHAVTCADVDVSWPARTILRRPQHRQAVGLILVLQDAEGFDSGSPAQGELGEAVARERLRDLEIVIRRVRGD